MTEHLYLNGHFVTKSLQVRLKPWSVLDTLLLAQLIRAQEYIPDWVNYMLHMAYVTWLGTALG